RAKIDLVRYEWHSVLRQHGGTGTLRYVSEKREILLRSDVVTLNEEPLEYTYSVPRSGEYSLRVSKDGETGYNQLTFNSYRWGTTDMTSFAVDPEARVEVVLDRETYAPGERARVLFQTPFDGRMLVTVERNSVYSYTYLDVVDNAASLEIPVTEEFLPTVYVGAVLFRNMKESDIPLMAGHGFAPLMVERPSNRLDVAIKAPRKIRPKTRQKVTVSVGEERDVCVTLAAVDEGICQVKNYETPDPYGHFYARRALEIETFDYFRDLIPEPRRSREGSSTGGGEAEMALRVNPLGVIRFKPVALWSGILRTDPSGSAEVSLDIPEFNGELRLMAIAYKGNRFGSAATPMTVSDPVVITPALPRFLSPNDSLTMAITAFNTTGKPVALWFSVETSGPVEALQKEASLRLGPNEERSVDVRLRAENGIGPATVTVKSEAFGQKLESTTELSVRPVSPYVAEVVTGFVEGGSSVKQSVPDLLLPYGREAYVSLSPYPVVNFARELKALVGYPHGCLEQTVSRAFPQIYLRDLAGVLDPSILEKGSPTYFVNEAITKLVSMQMFDGGFLYWPGGGEANNWSTVYATHFLLEAKKAGYAVSDGVIDPALRAVAGIARSKATEDSYTRREQRTLVRRIADKSCIYALYVLALSGKPERSVMNFYRTSPELLTLDTRYLLAGAYSLSGDRGTYRELIPSQFTLETTERSSGRNFDSPVRANAIVLNVLLETDLNNPEIPRYLDYLSRVYRSRGWYSTQDNAFTLLAFGKAARVASGTNLKGTLSVGGVDYTYEGGNLSLPVDLFGKQLQMEMSGEGRVYYSVVTKGIRRDGAVRIEDSNLRVRRELFDRTGRAVDPGSVRQNDLVIVRVSLTSSVNLLENVAVTDLLPAGFEIDNPRITETTEYSIVKDAARPEHLDIRDDRIIFYTSFSGRNRTQLFYYVVRAVSRGTFHYPAIVAEAMYDGRYYSGSGQALLKVR
ncbi:MAG: alpha-2-macroglobulin family protein, partial [Bacteroidota bacterium]